MKTYYRTRSLRSYAPLIEAVEVDRDSEQSVWIDGRRQAKESDWAQFHATWDGAKDYLRSIAERRLKAAQSSLETAESNLATVEALVQT